MICCAVVEPPVPASRRRQGDDGDVSNDRTGEDLRPGDRGYREPADDRRRDDRDGAGRRQLRRRTAGPEAILGWFAAKQPREVRRLTSTSASQGLGPRQRACAAETRRDDDAVAVTTRSPTSFVSSAVLGRPDTADGTGTRTRDGEREAVARRGTEPSVQFRDCMVDTGGRPVLPCPPSRGWNWTQAPPPLPAAVVGGIFTRRDPAMM